MSNLRMCPHCRAFISSSARACSECHETVGRTYAQRMAKGAALAGLVPPTHFTTLLILMINSALFAATLVLSLKKSGDAFWSIDGYVLYAFGAKHSLSVLAGGQWWRLVTAGFLHGGVLHLFMNSWALYDLGAQVEEIFGTARLLVIYLVSSVLGFLASCFWSRSLSIGASAALFGLIGTMLVYGHRNRSLLGQAMKAVYTRWAIYGLLFGLMPGLNVDNAAHLGGLAAGAALGYLADARRSVALDWLWKASAGFAILLAAASFLLAWLRSPAA